MLSVKSNSEKKGFVTFRQNKKTVESTKLLTGTEKLNDIISVRSLMM